MRLSIHPGDIGHTPDAVKPGIKVYLDDVEVKGCTIADEERGYLVRYADDQSEATTVPITERLTGVVRIEGYD